MKQEEPKQERLSTKLKNVLDNMSQEKFDQAWKKVTDLNLEGPSIIPPEKHIQLINNNIEEFDGQVEEFKKKEEPKKEFPTVNGSYGCTIPIKEPKQETLEEAAENYANKKGDIPTTELEDAIFKQGFIDGAKWKAGRMYSEEEVEQIAKDAYSMGRKNILISEFNLWIQEFKKI